HRKRNLQQRARPLQGLQQRPERQDGRDDRRAVDRSRADDVVVGRFWNERAHVDEEEDPLAIAGEGQSSCAATRGPRRSRSPRRTSRQKLPLSRGIETYSPRSIFRGTLKT